MQNLLSPMMKMPKNQFDRLMDEAESYEEWRGAALAHDEQSGAMGWKESDRSEHFDYKSIRRRLERLERLHKTKDDAGLFYALSEGLHGNMDGMGNDRLFEKARFGTKELIEDYVDAIVATIEHLASPEVTAISFEDKLDLLRRAKHCYGASALLLSGSGAYLYFHAGVAKALWQEGLLPQTMSGASGGAFVSGLICTRADSDMEEIFDVNWLYEKQIEKIDEDRPAFWSGNIASSEEIYGHFSRYIPDLTFEEAFQLTGRNLNISISPSEKHQTSRLLNAIASPNVYIREAVMASSAFPGVFEPVSLMAKNHKGKKVPYLPNRKWVDGSMSNDIPAKRLGRLYGVNHHIVSQANPLVSGMAVDISRRNEPFQIVRNASVKSAKAWTNATAALWQKPLNGFPRINSAVSMVLSVVNQEYLGDVNIIRPKYRLPLNKMMGSLDFQQVNDLVTMGERTTWPKIEMIRTQTKISQTLDQILFQYEHGMVKGKASAIQKVVA